MVIDTFFKRGEVYWVNLDPTLGSEVKKTRPAVIISNDGQNRVGKKVIVAPMTSILKKIYPFEVKVILGDKESKVMIDQIRAIDCQRIGRKLGNLSFNEMKELDTILKLVLALH